MTVGINIAASIAKETLSASQLLTHTSVIMFFMRLHRFLVNEKIGDSKEIIVSDPDLIHQWRNVFRFTTGTQLVLFDDSGFEFLTIIDRISHLGVRLRILNKEGQDTSSLVVTL